MDWHLNAYAASMFITTSILAMLAVYIWGRRPAPGATPAALLVLAVAEWSLGYAFELGSSTLSGKLFWTNFNFLGIVGVPILLFVFVLQYTHRGQWLTRRNLTWVASPALITLALVWTNGAHGLIRVESRLDTTGPISVLDPIYGLGFWAFWVYTLVLVVISFVLIVRAFVSSRGLYRRQSSLLFLSMLVPWVGNGIYLSGSSPLYGLDLTPFAFAVAGLGMAWGFYRYRFLDIVPVARDAIIESMSDGVVVLDDQTRLVDLNPAAEQIIGRTASEAIGQPAAQVLPGWASLTGQDSVLRDFQAELVLGRAGSERYFDLSLSPLYDQHARLTGQLVVFRDVTARKWASETLEATYRDLAEQHAKLDIILHNIADGLVVTDLEDRITLVNPVFADMLMRSSDELIGRRLSQVFEGLAEPVRQARQSPDQVITADVTLSQVVYRAAACVLWGGNSIANPDSPGGVVTVLRDITQEVEMARMKDELVSMVSHELRTPLTSVLGFASLIHKQFVRTLQPRITPDDREGQRAARRILENLEIIVDEGERLTRLINNVLDIAKMESGRVEWDMQGVSLGEVIQASVSAIQSLARDKGLLVEVKDLASLPPLWADRDRLIQVVTNLLSNAIKFTDAGKITVRAWQLAPGDDVPPFGARQSDVETGLPAAEPLVAVSVTDTGIGIAEADLSKVFEKFHQIRDRASETQRPGTGLGLSICKQIVAHHGGHIWVESRSGEGSRFVFTLPLKAR